MKKTICVLMAVCLMAFNVSNICSVADDSESEVVFYYENSEVTFTNIETGIDPAKLQSVADSIVNGESDDGATVYLICGLLGHDIATSDASYTTHCAYSTAPRCLEEFYHIEVCKRNSCDYSTKTLTGSTRFYCH